MLEGHFGFDQRSNEKDKIKKTYLSPNDASNVSFRLKKCMNPSDKIMCCLGPFQP